MFKLLSAVAVGIGLMLSGAPSAIAAPVSEQEGALVPKLDWRPCDPGFECATAKVPRDHSRPHGATIDLALIRFPATDRENRIGSLFVNPGGPGGSGIELVREAPPPALAAFGRLYDVVGFDPRGVGASSPPVRDCGVRYQSDQWVRPDTADATALLAAARDQLRRCEAGSGGILPYLTTANVARDLDLLRAAVGDRKLNYLGISYGALIGETYTTLFPGRTGALVIDSPVDGDVWLNRPFEALREQLASFEASFDRFLGWCGRHEEVCSLDPEDPEDDFDALVARLNDAPIPVLSDPAQPPVNGDELLTLIETTMRSKFFWAPFAEAVSQAESGDGSGIRAFFSGSGESTGAFFAYLANEVRYPRSVSRYLGEMEHNYALFDHLWWVRSYEWIGFTRWPFEPRGVYRGPFLHAAGVQTPLVIGGTHDPATPYKWAKRYVADLGNARLLTYRSDGHGAITDLNPCVTVAVLAYIDAGTLPPEGATCKQEVPAPASTAARSTALSRAEDWKRATLVDALR